MHCPAAGSEVSTPRPATSTHRARGPAANDPGCRARPLWPDQGRGTQAALTQAAPARRAGLAEALRLVLPLLLLLRLVLSWGRYLTTTLHVKALPASAAAGPNLGRHN